MAKKRANRKSTIQSHGSADRRRAPSRKAARGTTPRPTKEVLDGRQWRVASIAWNKDGNIVILDPAVAEYVRAHARVDRELEIGIPSIPVEVGAATDGETPVVSDSLVAGTPQKLPTMNTLCMCDGLRFHLAVESPILHELLSTSPLR